MILFVTKLLLILEVILLIYPLYITDRHGQIGYKHIARGHVYKELVFLKRAIFENPNMPNCSYEKLILSSKEINPRTITDVRSFKMPKQGGEYIPRDCRPLIKTAVIIPYRNRRKHLDILLNYMHSFLQNQNIHYRMFVVEQNDLLIFNKGQMYNYAAHIAINLNYDCLILHDVDLLPLNAGNIYGCTKKPRHMSGTIDIFRYNIPYPQINGGVVSILSQQYQFVNGMSNAFYGWGGEDDDFYNIRRLKVLYNKTRDSDSEGLNSLIYSGYIVQDKELFTHILAKSW